MSQSCKVVFQLEPDDDGYPPVSYEGLWAIPLSNGNMRVDNIPFYVEGISVDDEIEVALVDGEYRFLSIVKESGNSTFRLFLMKPEMQLKMREELSLLGCKSEFNQLVGLIAVEIPKETPIHPFLDFIVKGKKNGVLDYEESALRHQLN